MKLLRTIIVLGACFAGALPLAHPAPARFWISDNPDPPGWEAPTINAAIGVEQMLYIWAQPATDGQGLQRTLTNFSLDVVTQTALGEPEPQPIIDFIDGTYMVYNDPAIPGLTRFQYTYDSLTLPDSGGPLVSSEPAADVMEGEPDSIKGMQGLSIITTDVDGIGHLGDPPPYLVSTNNGPAWRVAEFRFKPLQAGTNHLFLQIGFAGMSHSGEGATQVVFGNNTSPVYTAGPGTTERQITLPGDTYDIRINAVGSVPGDYNRNGTIGQDDFFFWRSTFGQTVATFGEGADGNRNGVIDAADYVFWRKMFRAGSSSSLEAGATSDPFAVPEPTTAFALIPLFMVHGIFGRGCRPSQGSVARGC